MGKWKTAKAGKASPEPARICRKALLLLAIQLFLAVLFAFELFQAVSINWEKRAIAFSEDISVYIMMALILFTIFSINFVSKRRGSAFHSLDSGIQSLLKDTARAKLKRSGENPFSMALLLIDIAYLLVITMAFYLYLDPDPNLNNDWLLGWLALLRKSGSDLSPPWGDIAKVLAFAAITALFFYMHHHASKFDALDRHARARKIAEKKETERTVLVKKK